MTGRWQVVEGVVVLLVRPLQKCSPVERAATLREALSAPLSARLVAVSQCLAQEGRWAAKNSQKVCASGEAQRIKRLQGYICELAVGCGCCRLTAASSHVPRLP